MGILIAIEGIDSSGKKTHAHRLVEFLRTQGETASYRDFPRYDTVTGKLILGHLQSEWQAASLHNKLLLSGKSPNDELLLQCLFALNRYEMLPDLLQALENNSVVVCDRYYASGEVYGKANGVSPEFLETVHKSLREPDLTFFLDIPVSESWHRRPERRDRYEQQQGMMEKVRANYLALARQRDWYVIDALGAPDEVHARILQRLPTGLLRRADGGRR